MIIKNITESITKKETIFSCAIIWDGAPPAQELYFAIKNDPERKLNISGTPFLAAMLLPAMKRKENIIVEGKVSAKFLKGAHEIMNLYKSWNVGLFPITIQVEDIVSEKGKGKNIGMFFSAGVDSFYTYLKNKSSKKEKITTFILVQGFDIDITNTSFFSEVERTVRNIAKKENRNISIVRTNLKVLTDAIVEWDWEHGGALAAVALLFTSSLKQIYISGAVRQNQLFPYGTHPELDPLWSTENTQFTHEGTEYNRLEKVLHGISKSDLALSYLRVCAQNIKGKYNCSRCYKCLTTMIQLECGDALRKCKTFSKNIDLQAVRNMYYNYGLLYNLQGEDSLTVLRKKKIRPDLQEAIAYSLEKSKNPTPIRRFAFAVAKIDKKYNNRRLFNYIFQMNSSQDRKTLFKYLAEKGIIK